MPNILPPSAVSDPTEMSFLLRQLDSGDAVTFFYRLNSTSPVKSMTVTVEDTMKSSGNLILFLQKKGPMRPGQTGGPALEDRGHGYGVAYAASMGAKRIPVLALSKGKSAMVEDKAPTMKQAMASAQIALAAASKLMAGFDESVLGRSQSELDNMDDDERRDASLEDMNRAVDLMEAVLGAYSDIIAAPEAGLLKKSAALAKNAARSHGRAPRKPEPDVRPAFSR